jgi:hypothetical protein
MNQLLRKHLDLHMQAGAAAADWRRAVRQAVHACQAIRRADLHLLEALDKVCKKESSKS